MIDIEENQVVVDINQIGYLVYTNNTKIHRGTNITLYTYLAVRENALDLYGFSTKDELKTFELLLGLPKIGPKSALQILTQSDLNLLKQAVQTQDAGYLTKMSGIGKKSAEKIVLGLKDKLTDLSDNPNDTSSPTPNNHSSDTIDALIALGYSPHEAREAVNRISDQDPELIEANDILKAALRQLN